MIAADRPKTVGILREDHLTLMREWLDLADDRIRAERAKALRTAVKAAGCDIGPLPDRDEAQGIVDYWASAIASLEGESYPEILKLDDYVGEAIKLAGVSAQQVFAGLASDEERRTARRLFEDLIYVGPNGAERGPARTRAVLQQRIGGASLDRVLEQFVETGAIARLAGDTPGNDRFEASDSRLAEDWPDLREWLADQKDYDETRSRLMAQAERWQILKDPMQLARGRDLDKIDRFLGETDQLDLFIAASTRQLKINRNIRISSIIFVLLLLFAIGVVSYKFWVSINATNAAEDAQERDDELLIDKDAGVESLAPPLSGGEQGVASPPSREGAMWLGSIDRPKVEPVSGETATLDFDSATSGTAYRVLDNIRLRARLPDETYTFYPRRSATYPGSLIILQDAPRGYDRPNGRQYWANVRVVPRVYIQYARGNAAAIERLRRQLAAAGFDVPEAEETESAIGLNEVRYFNASDRATARYLASTLRRSDLAATRNVGCQAFDSSRLRGEEFIIELWVDLARQRSGRSSENC